MSPTLTLVFFILVLLLPLGTAILLRLLWNRLGSRQLAAIAALLFSLEALMVLSLARNNSQNLQIAGLTLMSPVRGLAQLPAELQTFVPTSIPEAADPIRTAAPVSTAQPTSTTNSFLTSTSLPAPTATTLATTTTPTATPSPTATATPNPAPTATAEPTATAAPTQASGQRRYTVESGDTLRSIADKFGVTVQALLDANDLTPAQADSLRPGQVLIIP